MTDFDKLIKEKTEQAEYAYKPSAWRNFRRFSGTVKPLKYWIVGSVSAILLGGAVATVVHLTSNRPQQEVDSPTVLAADSVLAGTPTLSETSNETQDSKPVSFGQEESSTRPKNAAKTPSFSDKADEVTPSHRVDSSNQSKNMRTRLGRPLVIDVDTIKENVPTDEELRNGHSRLF